MYSQVLRFDVGVQISQRCYFTSPPSSPIIVFTTEQTDKVLFLLFYLGGPRSPHGAPAVCGNQHTVTHTGLYPRRKETGIKCKKKEKITDETRDKWPLLFLSWPRDTFHLQTFHIPQTYTDKHTGAVTSLQCHQQLLPFNSSKIKDKKSSRVDLSGDQRSQRAVWQVTWYVFMAVKKNVYFY